ncbi:MAG: flagellar filament capping protein FliD [Polyangiaceae bacterium]|jgi:flagellar hook-associated protein 2|nr:flagellar filament capping protein FliD [Polyangiaceae bacterium]
MAITFGGLSSQIDTDAIVTELVRVERLPIDQLKTKHTLVSSARDSLSSFLSKLSSLRKAADALASPTGFNAFAAASSAPAVVATVTGAASEGSFNLDVQALAREQRNHSNTYASATTAIGQAGAIQIQVGAANPGNITVEATDSLTAVAAKINASGARVSASVLYNGSNYRLVVRGLDTGAQNAFTVSDPDTGLNLGAPANVVQTAQNSRIVIDNVTVERPTNQIVGVIPGVTLALTSTTTTPANVAVQTDPAALKDKINSFVSTYNDVMSAARLTAGFGSVKAANALLSGDGTIRDATARMARALGAPVAGASGLYRTLSSVGLTTQRDGSLAFDSTKLNAALLADPSAVQKLFVTDAASNSNGALGVLRTALDGLTTGEKAGLNARITAFGKEITRLDERAMRLEAQVTATEDSLRKRFTAMEQAVSRYKAQGAALAGLSNSPF